MRTQCVAKRCVAAALALGLWSLGLLSPCSVVAQRAPAAVDVPVCLMLPMFQLEDDGSRARPFNWVSTSWARAALLAVEHINSGDCSVLGAGCDVSLAIADGTRVRLRPYLVDLHSWAATDAPPAAKECLETGAQFVVGTTSSEQSNLVAAFVGGFGNLMLSSGAESPAFSKKEIYHNFARTAVNVGEYMPVLVDFALEMGWKQMAVMHNQDLFGIETAQVLESVGRRRGMAIEPMHLGTRSDNDIRATVDELIAHGKTVVCLLTFDTEVKRVLQIAKQEIEAAGRDFASYTWIMGSSDTEYFTSTSGLESGDLDPEELTLFQGLLGIQVHLAEESTGRLQSALRATYSNASTLLPVVEEMMRDAGSELPNLDYAEVDATLREADSFKLDQYSVHAYDGLWAVAQWIAASASTAAGLTQLKGSDVVELLLEGNLPGFTGAAGPRYFLPNGDWDVTQLSADITNYGVPADGGAPRHAVVATVYLNEPERLLLAEDQRIVWANGKEYPYVPHDGSSTPVLLPIIYGIAAATALLLLVVALQMWRNAWLKRRVEALTTVDELDLETPLGKVMDLLERLTAKRRSERPTQREIRELKEYVAVRANALTAPDLEKGLKDLDPALRQFLNMDKRREDSSFIVDASDLSGALLGSEASDESGFGSGVADDVALLDGNVELAKLVGEDFFLDLISPNSWFCESAVPLSVVVSHCVRKLRLVKKNKEAFQKLMIFTGILEGGYRVTGYHCKAHGADVTNRMMCIMNAIGLTSILPGPNEMPLGLVGLVAAAVHDYGHPQLNNAFLVHQEKPMAADFNNQAVAENYALREALRALMQPEMNFVDELNGEATNAPAKRQWFKGMVIDMVLATDMSRHFDLLSQFKVQVAKNAKLQGLDSMRSKWAAMNKDQRLLVLQIALKVADLGHCALPTPVHRMWVERLEQEFFEQGDLEREAGQRVSPLMDRNKPGPTAPSNQVGFMKVMVIPLFSVWTEAFPECMPLMDQLKKNYEYWQQLAG